MDKLKTRVLIISLIILALVSVSAVAAADVDDVVSADQEEIDLSEETTDVEQVSVDTQEADLSNEEIDKDILTAGDSGNFTELQQQVKDNYGGELVLTKDYTRLSGESCVIINGSITIDGAGYTIDADKLGSIFFIENGAVTLKNINFINGNATDRHYEKINGVTKTVFHNGTVVFYNGTENSLVENCNFTDNTGKLGGAINVQSNDITITKCNFENNFANTGGAIYSKANSTIVSDSNFTSNNATSGGAIYGIGNNLAVTNCGFSTNNATNGGAIYVKGDGLEVADSTFSENYASSSGSAIYIEGNSNSISGSNFTSNEAGAYSAIYIEGNSNSISFCNFTENIAFFDAGAVYLEGDDSTITDSYFSSNNGYDGGAVKIIGEEATIANSVFEDNYAGTEGYGGGDGGAIYLDQSSIGSTIDNCTFKGNNAPRYGGAIKIGANDVTITDSRFIENEASQGGAIHWEGDNGVISGSNFTDNKADMGGAIIGGSLFRPCNNLSISDCNFTGNDANGNGGGINLMGPRNSPSENLTVTDSYFSKNTAPNGEGGAISTASEGTTTIDGCTFEENEAITAGAICVRTDYGSINISDSVFNNNSATTGEGGSIYMDSPNILVDSCDFTNNTAVSGGAISVDRKGPIVDNMNISIVQSTFTENEASAGFGGAIHSEAPSFSVDHCEFLENTASESGGAVWHNDDSGSTNSYTDSKFINNTANKQGGALYVYANNTEVKNSEFSGNDAANGGAAFIQGTNNVIDTATFSNNTASRYAGAAYIAGYDNTIKNSEFNDNNAGISGGASLITGDNNAISNSEFNNNTASDMGGALYHYSGNLDVDNSNFTENKAVNGSAIYQEKGALTVSNSKLFDNQAHSDSLTLTVDINIFDANVTTDYRGNDNLLNGIYTKNNDVTLTNVEYWGYADEMITGSNVKPKDSADESEEGALVYNDVREAGINLTLVVYADGDEENPILNMTSETGIFGNITGELLKLKPGIYKAYAVHEEDKYYTYIKSETIEFEIVKVDVIVTVDRVVDYTGAVVDVIANVTDVYGNPIDGGTATFIIHYDNKIGSGLLMASSESHTAEVIDGQATFKDITLGAPGLYPSTIEYSGNDYYNSAENESEVEVLPLNTTTSGDDVSGTAGDKVDITADIVDQNGNPVQNGTAVLKVNGKEYTAEVKDGKATFKDVELPDESTEATIDYLGNDYYNPSSTTIQITVTAPEEPVDEPVEEPSTPVTEKSVPVTPAAGNPIALVVVALLSLVSTVSFGRKK